MFGPRTRQILVSNGVWASERIVVTSPPRFDAWQAGPCLQTPDTVVLCAFPHPLKEGAAAFPAVLTAFVQLAQHRRDLAFVVKCRDQYEIERVHAMLDPALDGVLVMHDIPMSALLRRTALAIGFGSLALVDALYSPAEVVAVRFAGCTYDEDVQFDERDDAMGELVRFVHCSDELRQLVEAAPVRRIHPQRDARIRLLHSFFCPPNPTYSGALDEALATWVRARRSGSAETEAV